MKKNNNTPAPIVPAKVENMKDVYNMVKYFSAVLGAAWNPEDQIKNYRYKDENGNEHPTFAPEVADRLQTLLDQAEAICEAAGVDICAIRMTNLVYGLKGWDVDDLNKEFTDLLDEHEEDTDVKGDSRAEFEQLTKDPEANRQYFAVIMNAWDELCSRHDGLKESGLRWFAGAEFVGYGNSYDVYIGDGNEPYIY